MMDITERFKDIVSNMDEYVFHILGCGAIGSSAAIQLARMGASEVLLYDFDKVEIQNIGVSHYVVRDIKKNKVSALSDHIHNINPAINVMTCASRFEHFEDTGPNTIVILAFDSMLSRKEAATLILKTRYKPFLLIDGRMGAEHYQQYTLFKPTLSNYLKTWYSDEDGSPEPCNAKATSYCSNMAGSFICNQVSKAITHGNIDKEFFFNFPGLTLERK